MRALTGLIGSFATLAACASDPQSAPTDAGFVDVAPGDCVPPAPGANWCTKSLDAVCSDGSCARDWESALDVNGWCKRTSAHDVTVMDTPQNGLRAIVLSYESDFVFVYLYDAPTGALVAVAGDGNDHMSCVGGASGFVVPNDAYTSEDPRVCAMRFGGSGVGCGTVHPGADANADSSDE